LRCAELEQDAVALVHGKGGGEGVRGRREVRLVIRKKGAREGNMVSLTGASVRSALIVGMGSRSERRSFTCLLQPHLERIPVDAAVLEVELVGEVVHFVDGVARHEPQRLRLAAATVLLARPRFREGGVGRVDRARMLERLALLLASEHFEDHAASASRTHRSCSRKRRRSSSRSAERGPWPVMTVRSSSQSGSVYSQT